VRQPIQVFIDHETYVRFRHACVDSGVSMSDVVRKKINEFLKEADSNGGSQEGTASKNATSRR